MRLCKNRMYNCFRKSKALRNEKSRTCVNAVHINNEWYLIDTTWGSGFVTKGGIYVKQLDMKYLFSNPSFLIIDHFPNDVFFQLLDSPISEIDFNSVIYENSRKEKYK